MKINDMYLEVLKEIGEWTTISNWAVRFAERYPDQLAKAERQAAGQKSETTGLREIAARMSSRTSTDAFGGLVEIDSSERPRKVRWISPENAKLHEQEDLEDDIEPLTRSQKEKSQFDSLSVKDKYRMIEIMDIIAQLNKFFGTDFELEHSKALLHKNEPGDHHPDNIQILLKSHNRKKSGNNWDRFTIEEQCDYITSYVKVQNLISHKMGLDIQSEVLDLVLDRLRKIW